VDDLIGQRQVVLKSLEANVGQIAGVSGATILGDGRVALVLDVPALFGIGAHGGATSWERVH
jgi:two-component system chemotaxis sensor kinase CheA